MTFTLPRTLFVSGVLAILVFVTPAVFWSGDDESLSLLALTDSLSLLLGYLAVVLLWGALRVSGGRMWHSLLWLTIGLTALTLVIMLGPLLGYYNVLGEGVMAVLRALAILVTVVSLALSSYWFYTIAAPTIIRWQSVGLYVIAMLAVATVFLVPTTITRTFGESVSFLFLAGSFLLTTGVVVAASWVFLYAGAGYYRFLTMYLLALVFLYSGLFFLLFADVFIASTGLASDMLAPVIIVLALTFFLTTALHLHQLEVYLAGGSRANKRRT